MTYPLPQSYESNVAKKDINRYRQQLKNIRLKNICLKNICLKNTLFLIRIGNKKFPDFYIKEKHGAFMSLIVIIVIIVIVVIKEKHGSFTSLIVILVIVIIF